MEEVFWHEGGPQFEERDPIHWNPALQPVNYDESHPMMFLPVPSLRDFGVNFVLRDVRLAVAGAGNLPETVLHTIMSRALLLGRDRVVYGLFKIWPRKTFELSKLCPKLLTAFDILVNEDLKRQSLQKVRMILTSAQTDCH